MFDQVLRAKGVTGRSLVAVALVTVSCASLAQDVGEFEPLGLRTGQLNIFPSITFGVSYNDNVLAVPDDNFLFDQTADGLVVLQPELFIETNTERHSFFIDATADLGRYFELDDQDYNDVGVVTGGTWDLSRTLALSGRAGFFNDHESADDPDRRAEQLLGTTEIDRYVADVSLTKNWDRGSVRLVTAFRRSEFDDVNSEVFPNLASLSALRPTRSFNVNADRDFSAFPTDLRVTYEAGRTYDVFFNLGYRAIRYDKNAEGIQRWAENGLELDCSVLLAADGPEEIRGSIPGRATTREDCFRTRSTSEGRNRDFDTFNFTVGSDLDIDELVAGSFSVGLAYATFEEPPPDRRNLGFSFDADLDWQVTPRTVLNFSGAQGFEPRASGASLVTDLGSELTFALTRQALLGGRVFYGRDDRDGIDRVDNNITAGLFAAYTVNRHVSLAASYDYRQRLSNEPEREFKRNAVFLTLTGQY